MASVRGTGDDDVNERVHEFVQSDAVKLLQSIMIPLLVAAVIGGFSLVLRNQAKSDTKMDTIATHQQQQAVKSAIYFDRVDGMQKRQDTLTTLATKNSHDIENLGYRVGTLEEAQRQQVHKTRPGQ